MRCPDCLGKGFFYRYEVLMDDDGENPVLGTATQEPCRTCGGCGFTNCCEGEACEIVGPSEVGQISGVTNLSKNPIRIYHSKEAENGLGQIQRITNDTET